MALARSFSGPGALSINTNSANNLFGSGTTPASGGMFGSTQVSKPGGLFGSTTTTSAPASSGLFGSTTTTQPASGGLFGSAAPTQQTGGLFGSAQPASQPASGGLFGAAPTTTQPQSGGLFGSSTATPAAGGLFGSTAATQAQPSGGLSGNTGAGSLFGALNQQNQQQTQQPASGSLFGGLGQSTQNQQAQPQQQTGMYSQTAGFGGSRLGQQAQQQQQTVPGVRIDMSNIRGTTRFTDLHEDIQKEINNLDTFIQAQINMSNQCRAIMPNHESQLVQVPNDYEFCRRKKIGVDNSQDSDIQSIAQAGQLVKVDAEAATLSFRAIDNLKLPPQYHNSGMWSNTSTKDGSSKADGDAQDVVGFFSKTADDLKVTLDKYQSHVTEIEQHLRGVEGASAQQINALVARKHGGSRTQVDPVEDLTAVLREFEQSLLGVAGRVGGAREAVQSAQLDGFMPAPNGRASVNGNSVNGNRRGIY